MALHLRARLLRPLVPFIRRGHGTRRRHTLLMTLLVRDEADIVRENVEFHLRAGVDHIFATDNGSTDGTAEILEAYAREGVLTLTREPDLTFKQSTWVNRMADAAFARFGRCLIFHSDADEFWTCSSGDLGAELERFPLADYLIVPVRNVILRFRDFRETFPADARLDVIRPLRSSDVEQDSHTTSMILFPSLPKVLLRARAAMPHVRDGNHRPIDRRSRLGIPSATITIRHYPIRGFQHFQRKVIQGGGALVSNAELKPNIGWHWRRWYQHHLAGTLREAYRQLVMDEAEESFWTKRGVIQAREDLLGRDLQAVAQP